MKKSSIIIIAIVSIFAIFIGYEYMNDKKVIVNEEGKKFKEEYELLNNKKNKDGNTYPEIEIPEDNIIKYSTYQEIEDIITSSTGVIYLGSPELSFSRIITPILIQASREAELDKIYYLNIEKDRKELILDENNKIITRKSATSDYTKLIEILNEHLSDYLLYDSEGNEINTNEKYIALPMIIFIKNGKIIGQYFDTKKENSYNLLTETEEEALLLKFIGMMSKVSGTICDESC